MNRSLSDLVTDARLESEVHADHTIHALSISDPTAGHRLQKYQQRWNREKLLGSGGFGTVWLERCVDGGVLNGSLRAVKEIKRDATGVSSIDYSRELEAIAKFSQKPVGICPFPASERPMYFDSMGGSGNQGPGILGSHGMC